jgi:phospholipase/lecithinase/hemolysin
MLQNRFALIIAAALIVAGCGGSGGNPAPAVKFSSQVVFGDSLSDVGTYQVGLVKALGGGLYTVNKTVNGTLAPQNWTELVAPTLGLPQPCPAVTGLNGNPAKGLRVPVTPHPGCTSYAMGGAMVTYPFGPGNASTLPFPNGNPVNGSSDLGQLTYPIVTQIQNHLALRPGNKFAGDEIVFLLAGGNDAIVNTLIYVGTVRAASANGQAAAAAAAAVAGPAAVQAMAKAGGELAGYINNLILAKGANYVALLTLPDLSGTPFAAQVDGALPGTKALVSQMVQAFNNQLLSGLIGSKVLVIDLYGASVQQFANPAAFGLTNIKDTACNLDPAVNPLGSSLVCNVATNVIPGNITNYAFADLVHPTPYGYYLIANLVAANLGASNWLSN